MHRVAFSVALNLAVSTVAAGELSVAATELRIGTDAGLVRGAEVAGAELELPGLGTVRIASAERDAGSRFGDIWLYRVELADGRAICDADPGGDTRLVFFPGRFDAQLNYVDDPAEFSISCVSGVQAKCLRWGYRPWAQAPLGGQSLAPYYNACIRAARADYCGDDQPTTRDGTLIDLYDRVGVQVPESDPGQLQFEAGWAPHGAVCVHHVRIADSATLDGVRAACPRLAAAPAGGACSEAAALDRGALLFNRSRP